MNARGEKYLEFLGKHFLKLFDKQAFELLGLLHGWFIHERDKKYLVFAFERKGNSIDFLKPYMTSQVLFAELEADKLENDPEAVGDRWLQGGGKSGGVQ